MAKDTVLHYSLSHWEEQDTSTSSQIQGIGCDVRSGAQADGVSEKMVEQDETDIEKIWFETCEWTPGGKEF